MMRSLLFISIVSLFVPVSGCAADGELRPDVREKVVATTQVANDVASVTPSGSIIHEIAIGLSALAGLAIAWDQSVRRGRESERKREALEKLAEANRELPPKTGKDSQ